MAGSSLVTTLLPLRPATPTTSNRDSPPVGARLALFLPRWTDLFPRQSWVCRVVEEGVRISFTSPPPLSDQPRWIKLPKDPVRAVALRAEVQALLQKDAFEVVRDHDTPGFYAHLFVVLKPGGKGHRSVGSKHLHQRSIFSYGNSKIASTLYGHKSLQYPSICLTHTYTFPCIGRHADSYALP
jgi:hypothetical protein